MLMNNAKAVYNNGFKDLMTSPDPIYIISNNITGMGKYKYSNNLSITRRIKWL